MSAQRAQPSEAYAVSKSRRKEQLKTRSEADVLSESSEVNFSDSKADLSSPDLPIAAVCGRLCVSPHRPVEHLLSGGVSTAAALCDALDSLGRLRPVPPEPHTADAGSYAAILLPFQLVTKPLNADGVRSRYGAAFWSHMGEGRCGPSEPLRVVASPTSVCSLIDKRRATRGCRSRLQQSWASTAHALVLLCMCVCTTTQ